MLLLNFPAKSFKGGRYVQAEDKSPPVAETAFPLIFNIFEHKTLAKNCSPIWDFNNSNKLSKVTYSVFKWKKRRDASGGVLLLFFYFLYWIFDSFLETDY